MRPEIVRIQFVSLEQRLYFFYGQLAIPVKIDPFEDEL